MIDLNTYDTQKQHKRPSKRGASDPENAGCHYPTFLLHLLIFCPEDKNDK